MTEIKRLGYLGLTGAVLVGIGEFFLHYSPNVLESGKAFEFFSMVSSTDLKIGHFFVIIGIPFYFFGYLHIYKMLVTGKKNYARAVLFLGFIAFSVGAVWIGSRGFLGSIVHLKDKISLEVYAEIIKNYDFFIEVLVNVLRIVIALLSILFSITILKGGTRYQKKMAFFSPLTILLISVFIGLSIPSIGKYFLPILMNSTHFILFSISIYQLKKQTNHV